MPCSSSDPTTFCSEPTELKLYQGFIFSIPVFFTFILLVLFYLFYLRRPRASWASIRMRVSQQAGQEALRPAEPGLKKEVREMLPVVIFRESFLIRETQCSVCLGDYKADDRLKRIPPCGHTFHVQCIDNWLANNTTCPLCRASLIPGPKVPSSVERPPADDVESQGAGREEEEEQVVLREEPERRDGITGLAAAGESDRHDSTTEQRSQGECVVNLEVCGVQHGNDDPTVTEAVVTVGQNSVV